MLVFIHGWGGNKNSFKKVAGSFAIKNSVWFLPQAPYLLDEKINIRGPLKNHQENMKERACSNNVDFLEEQVFSRFDSKMYLYLVSHKGH